MAACSAASASALRSVGPAMVKRQSACPHAAPARAPGRRRPCAARSSRPPAAAAATRCPLARGAGSVPGSATVIFGCGTAKSAASVRAVVAAGDDDMLGQRQRRRLERAQFVLAPLRAVRPPGTADGARARRSGCAMRADDIGRHGAIGQAIDQQDGVARHSREQRAAFRQGRRASAPESEPGSCRCRTSTPSAAAAPARAGHRHSRRSAG